MSQIKYKLFLPILVSSIGLASCSKEKPEDEAFKTQPPVIRLVEDGTEISDLDLLKDHELSLRDIIDYSRTGAARIDIATSCTLENQIFSTSRTFAGAVPVVIFQILPAELWLADLVKSSAVCSLEVMLSNSSQSKHMVVIPTLRVRDDQKGQVQIINAKAEILSQSTLLQLRPSVMSDLSIKFDRPIAKPSVELHCESQQSERVPLASPMPLSALTWHVDEERAWDRCRVLVYSGDQPVAMSPLVQWILRTQEMQIQAVPTFGYVPLRNGPGSVAAYNEIRAGNRKHVIAHLELHNTDPTPRYFQFSIKPQPAAGGARDYDKKWQNHRQAGIICSQSITMSFGRPDDSPTYSERLDWFVVEVPPGQTVRVPVWMDFSVPGQHENYGQRYGIFFGRTLPFTILEVDAQLNPVQEIKYSEPIKAHVGRLYGRSELDRC